MLKIARAKNSDIHWKIGTAENTGLSNHCVDGIVGSLTIHHWTNLNKAFSELYRVLKPNGLICLIENTTNRESKEYWYFRSVDQYKSLFPFCNLKHIHDYSDLGQTISVMIGRSSDDS